MNKLVLLITLICLIHHAQAQINLVPNAGFEDTLACPSNVSGQYGDEIYKLTHWFPVRNSADFFNTCSSNQNAVPLNATGFQYPHIGSGYIGLFTIGNFIPFPNYREYVGVQLSQSLIIGTKYYFTMYLSSAFGGQGIYSFSNNVGFKLSTIQYEAQSNPLAPDNLPTGFCFSIIQDTTSWLTFRFSFTADSAYSFLYLGNFFDDFNTDSIGAFGSSGGLGAYYYLDDICLSTDSLTCETITRIDEQMLNYYEVIAYPNPVGNELYFKNINAAIKFQILDIIGQELMSGYLNRDQSVINLQNLKSGIYYIRILNDSYTLIKLLKL